ncbi:MAG: MATE family efflux transporter [Lachnospiraceae bacterium]|nr:MATE family efflux transporter [Lachnospiraceae bacterium]
MKKKIAKYVSLNVIGMVGLSVYILADTFFISWGFGADGLAVLNMTLPLYGLMYALGSMIGIGSSVIYSLRRASGKDVSWYFMQSICWTLIISIPFVLLGIFVPKQVLALMGADAALQKMGEGYARLCLMFAPAFMCNYTFTAFCRNDRAPGIAMAAQLSGSAFNIVFDYVFMFVCGLGFTGAALATICCPGLSMLICLIHFLGKKNTVGFSRHRLSFSYLKSAVPLGMSGFVGEISNGFTSLVFNYLCLGIAGNVAVAAYSVIANIALVVVAIFNGISQGLQPLISDSYGKGRKDDVSMVLRSGLIITAVAEALFVAAGFLATDPMIGIFNSQHNAELLAIAHSGLRQYFLGFVFAGINIFLLAYYSATARARIVVTGSLLRGMILIALYGFVLSRIFGLSGVFLSFAASELTTLIVILAMGRFAI